MIKLHKSIKPSTDIIVYETTDYSIFTPYKNQREVGKYRKKRLETSFKTHSGISIIIVNENYEIIDGLGRFTVAKEAGTPIYFVIEIGADTKSMLTYNTTHMNWSLKDYLTLHCASGTKDYQTFENFVITYGLSISSGICLAHIGTHSGGRNLEFREGKFKFKDYKKTLTVAKHAFKFELTYGDFCKKTNFLNAIITMVGIEGYSMSKMEKQLNKYGNIVEITSGNASDILYKLKSLYNKNRPLKNHLH